MMMLESDLASLPAGVWAEDAACSGEDLSLFFAPNYFEKQAEKKAREAKAKLICRGCPVREACLEFGMAASEGHGVWGGLNERERRRLALQRARIPMEIETVA